MYAPLQVFSSYSLLKNPNTIHDILKRTKEQGYQAVALADWDALYGVIDFYQQAQQSGIKPILGLTLRINGLINTATQFPILLTAVTDTGYQNLMWLSSAKMTSPDGQLTLSNIAQHLAGLAASLPYDSELVQLICAQDEGLAAYWQQLTAIIPAAQLYLGINPQMAPVNQRAISTFAQTVKAQLIALDRVDYLHADDAFASEVLKAVAANTTIDNLDFLAHRQGQNILRPVNDVATSYQANAVLQRAYANNQALVDQIDVTIHFQKTALPTFATPEGQQSSSYLKELATAGLARIVDPQSANYSLYQERLTHELTIIDQLGFSDYFLIVGDILNFAHTHAIQTGAGRGSAAGSLVAYALQITDVDPLAFDLLFERFLNADRAQMPDIDIDWPDNRREEILNYLHDKYGQRNFAQIITFGTLAAKQALRDTGRVFGLSSQALSRLSAAIPVGKNGRKVSIQEALATGEQLQKVVKELPHGSLLLKTAQKIEGLPRNYSTHAAGVVLSNQPLVNTLPVQLGSDQRLLTQFEKGPVEALGLLKIDILGLTNLTILSQALRLAQANLPENFDIRQVPLDDPDTLALFARGDTSGVFQFESNGIRNVLRQLQPDCFEHIVAVNALYRPGPSQNIRAFIDRRHGRQPVQVLDDSITPILAPTFGIIIYQEQVMRVAEAYAGFSLGQADVLRSAMSKKKLDTMESMRALFIKGALAKGHSQEQAEQIFAYIDEFANYGFNRSHAVAYSKLAFELAYLKAHYPLAFYTALLNANLGRTDKVRQYVLEAKQAHIQVQGPNINYSQRFWTNYKGSLRMGLHSIRGIRSDFVAAVLTERKQNGPFKSIQSFIRRLPEKMRKLDTLNQLVHAGALDNFGYNRAELLVNFPDLIAAADFGELILQETKVKKVPDAPLTESLRLEKEAIGLNLSGHPLDAYQTLIHNRQLPLLAQIQQAEQTVTVIGLIDAVKTIRTKKGDQMAFVTLSDETGSISVTLFPNRYQEVQGQLKAGQVVEVTGKSEERQGMTIIANRFEPVTPTSSRQPSGTWFLRLDANHDTPAIKKQVIAKLQSGHGQNPVVIYWPASDKKQQLSRSYWLGEEKSLMTELAAILGPDNVIFQKKD